MTVTVVLLLVGGASPLQAQQPSGGEEASEEDAEPGAGNLVKSLGSYEARPLGELMPRKVSLSKIKLETLLEKAQKQAPAIEQARARVQKGEARVDGTDVLTKYNPVIQAEVERFPFGEFSFGEAKVGVSQRFTIAGEQTARLEAARVNRKLLNKRLREVRWRVHARVHRLYNLAMVDLDRLRLADQQRKFFEDLRQIAGKRVEAGEVSKIVLQLGRAELARSKQRVVQARTQLISRLRNLEEVVGWEADQLPIPTGELPAMGSGLEAEKLQDIARENYPPVTTRQVAIDLAEARHEFQTKKAWPDPGVGLFYKLQSPNVGGRVSGLVAKLSLPIPIWNANRLERMVSASEISVARTRLKTLRQKLGPKVADAVQSLNAAAEQVEIYGTEIVEAFERELEMLRKGYRVGEFDITDVTVAQERLLESRRQALEARAEYFEAAARLERLTGRDLWE